MQTFKHLNNETVNIKHTMRILGMQTLEFKFSLCELDVHCLFERGDVDMMAFSLIEILEFDAGSSRSSKNTFSGITKRFPKEVFEQERQSSDFQILICKGGTKTTAGASFQNADRGSQSETLMTLPRPEYVLSS